MLSTPQPKAPVSAAGQAWGIAIKIVGLTLIAAVCVVALAVYLRPSPLPASAPIPIATSIPTLKVGQDAVMTHLGQRMWAADEPSTLTRLFSDVNAGAQVSQLAAVTQYGVTLMPEGTRTRVLEFSTVNGFKLARIQLTEQTQIMVQTWTVAEWLQPLPASTPIT